MLHESNGVSYGKQGGATILISAISSKNEKLKLMTRAMKLVFSFFNQICIFKNLVGI